MKILITCSTPLLFFQEVIIIEVLIQDQFEIYLQANPDSFPVPNFPFYQKKIDYRFSNYSKSPFAAGDVESLTTNPRVHFHKEESVNLHLDLSGAEFHNTRDITTWKPHFAFNDWFNLGSQAGTTTSLSICDSAHPDKTLNTLVFTSERGVFNNTCKAFFYLPYLISKTLAGEKNVQEITTRPQRLKVKVFYADLLYKIISRKWSPRRFNWKLAVLERGEVQLLPQPPHTFWADPFPVTYHGKKYVFFEEYDVKDQKGHLCCMELEQGKLKNKQTVLREAHHLSFPNVFEWKSELYMLPEKSDSGKLHLYKCTRFPNQWEIVAELFADLRIVDPAWLFKDGRYWLLFNKIEAHEHENNERLYAYSADSLCSGTWYSHPQNPVVINKKSARNAGQIIHKNGTWLRPAQDCSKTYGASVRLQSIKVLDPEAKYEETTVEDIVPCTGFKGLHTYNESDGVVLIDLLSRE